MTSVGVKIPNKHDFDLDSYESITESLVAILARALARRQICLFNHKWIQYIYGKTIKISSKRQLENGLLHLSSYKFIDGKAVFHLTININSKIDE